MKNIWHLCIAFAILIASFIWGKEYAWAMFFLCVGIVLVGFEIWSCYHGADVSMSGNFWILDLKHPIQAHAIVIVMALFWAYLCGHLLWEW